MTLSILMIAGLSYFFRILPRLINVRFDENSPWLRGLDYTVCAMMGQIIMDTATGGKSISSLIHHFDAYDIAALLATVGSFIVCRNSGSIFKSLLSGLTIFSLTVGVIQ
jgi:branched-subunit amino acid transport protein